MCSNRLKIAILCAAIWAGTASCSEAQSRGQEAADILMKLCVAGGSVTTSRATSSPSGGAFRLESDKGSFTVESREARGLVDGISSAMTALSAQQADRARECMIPYIGQVFAIMIGPAPSVALAATGPAARPPAATGPVPQPPAAPRQEAEAPASANKKLEGVPVIYYQKAADGSQVTEALKRRGISFTQVGAVLPETMKTNVIWCAPGTPASAIQELALALIDGGVPVQAVERIRTKTSTSTNRLLVGSRRGNSGKPLVSAPLSRTQIASIAGCPDDRDRGIANFTRFENPRATQTRGDNRHVDTAFDSQRKRHGDAAAILFCTQRGLADTVAWRIRRMTGSNVVSVRLGDNSTCTADCSVFDLIVCN